MQTWQKLTIFWQFLAFYTCDLTPGHLGGQAYFLWTTFFHKRIADGCCWQHCTVHSYQHERRVVCWLFCCRAVFLYFASLQTAAQSQRSPILSLWFAKLILHQTCVPQLHWGLIILPMAADGAYCLPLLYHVTSPPLRLSGLLSVTLISLGSRALVSNYRVAAPISSHLHLASSI